MPLTLRKATAADAAVHTDIYFSAFSVDAISLLVFPRASILGSRDFPAWTWCVEEIEDLNSHFICIYDSDSPDQTVVAYAKWVGRDGDGLFGDADLPEWPAGADSKIANHFFGSLVDRHAAIMKGKRHWYLEIICTRTEYQGKGAAGNLLRWGIEKSVADGTETYLEASPDGKPIYEHLGFREVERLRDWWLNWRGKRKVCWVRKISLRSL
ncbi:hypothetical protein WAI453_005268 [Rhynchosporium graminicola]|uniref:N-acetyltransferase domain-containing protein n=1 Tax=Rhynchosporium graminicola TaxID=2792576 RepID=A0A1E1L643_9HELO|nr:uncharacterized protein RCO7_05186 [Rhynchosporium commune]